MGFVVLAVGALLSVVGAYEIYYGNSVIAVERGWSAFIGGSVLFAGGIVTAAIGLAVHVLLDLRRLLSAATLARPAEIDARPPAGDASRREDEPSAPSVPEAAPEPLPEPPRHEPLAETPRLEASSAVVPQMVAPLLEAPPLHASHEPAPPLPAEAFRDPAYARPAAEPAAWRAEAVEPPAAIEAHEVAPPTVPALAPAEPAFADAAVHDAVFTELPPPAPHADDAGTPASETATVAARETPASAVIGRYESEGTSYVMYADGSIDAQSGAGVYRFASMAELKAFIEG